MSGYTKCEAGHRYFDTFVCTKPRGHEDEHGYAGSFWHDAEATDPVGVGEEQSTMTVRERLTSVLCDRLADFDVSACKYLAEKLAETLLALPGIAAVELPAPDSDRYEGDGHEPADRLCWMPGDDFEVSVWNQGEVQRCGFGWGDDEPLSVAEARSIGLTLLAAADAAEATE